jgi:hypothetical protein
VEISARRRYYELLFAGELGFRLERVFTSYPRIGPFEIPDDAAEEALTVYDHPKVLVFRKTPGYAHARAASLLGAVSLANIVRVPPNEYSALYRRLQPADVPLAGERTARTAVLATGGGSMASLARWIVAFETLSLALFVLLFRPLRRRPIAGMASPSARMACAGNTRFGCSRLQVLRRTPLERPFDRRGHHGRRDRDRLARPARSSTVVRESSPSPRHRDARSGVPRHVCGLCRFEGLQSRSGMGRETDGFRHLKRVSPLSRRAGRRIHGFAGESLNYFYFGHALTGVFANISGVSAAFAFNLAIPTLAALLSTAAFIFFRQMNVRLATSAIGAFTVVLVGNLAGPRLLAAGARIGFDYFWATSRVIPNTINEYPFWSLAFADLHAHVLALPLEATLLIPRYAVDGSCAAENASTEPSSLSSLPGYLARWRSRARGASLQPSSCSSGSC